MLGLIDEVSFVLKVYVVFLMLLWSWLVRLILGVNFCIDILLWLRCLVSWFFMLLWFFSELIKLSLWVFLLR